jgi:dUTP pyrophosphatase
MFKIITFETWKNIANECHDELGIKYEEFLESYENIEIPRRETIFSAGYVFRSPFYHLKLISDKESDDPYRTTFIPTGIRVELPESYFMEFKDIYELSVCKGLKVDHNASFIATETNRGKVANRMLFVPLISKKFDEVRIRSGDPIAQAVVQKYEIFNNELPPRKPVDQKCL